MNKTFNLTLIFSLLFLSRAAIDLTKWELFEQDTFKLSFRGLKLSRLLSTDTSLTGAKIRYLDTTTQNWIAIGEENHVTTHKFGPILEYASSQMIPFLSTRLTGVTEWALDINVNADRFDLNNNYLWYITSDQEVFCWTFSNGQHTNMLFPGYLGSPSRIAVNPNGLGYAWVVLSNGNIYECNGVAASWVNIPGSANDIAVTSTGDLYIVSKDVHPDGGFYIKKRTSTGTWEEIEGISGSFITFDSDNNLYVIRTDFKAYRQKGKISQFCPRCNSPDFGYCTPTKSQCLNCPPRKTVVTSPSLSCQPCADADHCNQCKLNHPEICTACDAGYLLTSSGTCITPESCVFPAILDPTTNICKGPCVGSTDGVYYYPDELQKCRSYCGMPKPDADEFYEECLVCDQATTCHSCPSDIRKCKKCIAGYFINDFFDEICTNSCNPPFTTYYDADGNIHCKFPTSEPEWPTAQAW